MGKVHYEEIYYEGHLLLRPYLQLFPYLYIKHLEILNFTIAASIGLLRIWICKYLSACKTYAFTGKPISPKIERYW